MDRVRFGRALGVGARAAAKSLMSAAEAAAAPAPSTPAAKPAAKPDAAVKSAAKPVTTASRRPDARVVKTQARAIEAHSRTLGRSVWKPFARFSNVLWLEVTGTFFAIFALIAGNEVWKWRAAVRLAPSAPGAQRLYVYVLVFVLFAYFAVSSFVRANRRQRR